MRDVIADLIWDWLKETGSDELMGCGVSGPEDVEDMLSHEFLTKWQNRLSDRLKALSGRVPTIP